jgi:maleylacetoacetate isomerase
MSVVVLYDYWRSSASYRVRIALNLAGIAYESVAVDLMKREHKAPEHLARNPQGLVPALLLDGHLFNQSLAIIEYLDETRGLNLLPTTPAARTEVRALAYAVAMDIHPVCNMGIVAHVMKLTEGGDAVRQAWMKKFIGEGLAAVEQLLQRTIGPLSFGDSPTLADVCLLPQVYNARRWSADISGLARVNAISTALETIPAFVAAYPDKHQPKN